MKFSYSTASLALFLDISTPTWAKIIKKSVSNGVRGGDDARPKEADLDLARVRSRFFEDFEDKGKNGCTQFTIESELDVIRAGSVGSGRGGISASNLFPFWNEGDYKDDDSIIVDNPPAGSYSANIVGAYWDGANDDGYTDCSYTGQYTFIDDFDAPDVEDVSLITVSGTCATAGAFAERDTPDSIPEEGFAVITGGFGEYKCATGFIENVSEGGDDPLVKVQFNVCKTGCLGLKN